MRILVVEDEVKIAKSLEKGLTSEGYVVDIAFDAARQAAPHARRWVCMPRRS